MASLLAVVSTACYTYAPIEDRPSPGDEVRVHLAGADDRGTDSAREFQGLVMESDADTLRLSLRLQASLAGTFERPRRQAMPIPYSEIERIETPRVDALRTGALVVGSVGALVGFMALILGSDDTGTAGDGGGNGPSLEVRIVP